LMHPCYDVSQGPPLIWIAFRLHDAIVINKALYSIPCPSFNPDISKKNSKENNLFQSMLSK
jgi:hypothetical protein